LTNGDYSNLDKKIYPEESNGSDISDSEFPKANSTNFNNYDMPDFGDYKSVLEALQNNNEGGVVSGASNLKKGMSMNSNNGLTSQGKKGPIPSV